MLTPNEAYQYDSTFRRVVNLMCAYLSEYEITPAELRQAAILAATMHADRCIKPLYIAKPRPWQGMEVFIDEAKDITPAMFGGLITNAPMRTATGSTVGISRIGSTVGGSVGGRFPSDGTTVTQVDKGSFKCICGLSEHPNRSKHTHTCNDTNWEFYHPKVTPIPPQCAEHCHLFVGTGKGYSVCNDCGMSDVYYNWAYLGV
jgi:hypothetical protein